METPANNINIKGHFNKVLLEKGNEHTDEDKIRQMIVCHGHILNYLRKNWAENLAWKRVFLLLRKCKFDWRNLRRKHTREHNINTRISNLENEHIERWQILRQQSSALGCNGYNEDNERKQHEWWKRSWRKFDFPKLSKLLNLGGINTYVHNYICKISRSYHRRQCSKTCINTEFWP